MDPLGGQGAGKGVGISESKQPRMLIMVSVSLPVQRLPILTGIFLEKSGISENLLPVPVLELYLLQWAVISVLSLVPLLHKISKMEEHF